MAAIAVPDEVCEEEGMMAPHFVVRSSAVRVTRAHFTCEYLGRYGR